MASSEEDSGAGEIELAKYSLVKLPSASSQVVMKAQETMLGSIDLEAFVDDLGRLGNCVRIAYHGVAGYTDLQIDVQRIGYDVVKLCDKSALTVSHFKKASNTVLHALQATYEYLLDSLEDMALDTLGDVADTAQSMAEAAENLHVEFDKQAKVVVEALEKTQKQQGVEEKEKERLASERKKMAEEQAKAQALHKEAQEAARKSESLYLQAQQKEQDALELHEVADNSTGWKSFVNGVFGVTYTKRVHHEEAAKSAKEEKMKHLEKMFQQQKIRGDAIVQLAEYAKRIQNIKEGETQTEAAIEALVIAIGALKSLSMVMLQAAQFWKHMQMHCNELASDKMKKEIERALKLPEERRLRVWKSSAFVKKGVRYYAEWVALDCVCTQYVERIKLTQRELYAYMQEALPTDKAHAKVKELAKSFGEDLKKTQDTIEARKAKRQKEMDSLLALKESEE